MTRILHGAEVLVPLALLHCLAIRLDRLLFGPAPVPAPAPVVAPMVVAACASTAPSLATLTTVELRKLAQARGITTGGGRRTSKARKADLLIALA